ncbi:UNVERIFIED_CONTAM: hypothetical protein Sradi_6938000 [Sesamum radiatum]|uniref:Reverse transcriptase zinc-binding domain-containing protein n=1 Tax=Sesamum radiatum TaxID=300843 RepID=A0AAW2JGF0_SESRA
MRGILDMLISPSQNAFVPGRAIGDNILLAQELFSGYNQKHLPPRCALKVDLRKAYDTVEWDFLRAVLMLFGFPEQFIQWIVNGGFSFHWRCDRIQLFQLGFADDLLLFSKADPNSVSLFKEGLTTFAELSGLQANLHKSHLILSSSAAPLRATLLTILGFQEGHLPLRYLGLPLLASRLSVADCHPIIQKIEARIRGWDGILLSFAGRVQLIKSVLSALQVYWAMAFILPKHVIKDIEKRLRNFLWKGSIETGYAKRSSIWVNWISHYRLRNCSVWTISTRSGTWGWRKLIRLRDSLRPCITYRIGDGASFSLWHDPWHDRGPLISQFPLGPRHTSLPASAPLSLVIFEGNWTWPPVTHMESVDITHDLPTIHGGPDRIRWTGPRGAFSAAAAYTVFCPPGPKVGWSSLLRGTFKIPRQRFILWLAILGRLSTMDKPWLQHLGTTCVLCQEDMQESHEHLFFLCPYATMCLRVIRRMVTLHWPYNNWTMVIRWTSVRWRGKHVVSAAYRALLCFCGLPSMAGAQSSDIPAHHTDCR